MQRDCVPIYLCRYSRNAYGFVQFALFDIQANALSDAGMEQAERSAGVDYRLELPAWRRVFCRIGYLNRESCRPVVHALISWIVFVAESHAALYGKWQPRLGGLEDDGILIASVVELLCYFLVSCSGSDNASFVLR
jgi:hypothetical protein